MCTVAKFISLWTSGLCACSLRFSRFLPHGHKAAASTLCTVFLYHGIQKHNVRMDTSLCVYFDQGGIFPRQPSQTYSSHLTGPNWVPYQFLNHSWQVMICLRKTGYTGFECIASVSEQYPKLGFKYVQQPAIVLQTECCVSPTPKSYVGSAYVMICDDTRKWGLWAIKVALSSWDQCCCKKRPENALTFSLPCEHTAEGSCLQARKWALTKNLTMLTP